MADESSADSTWSASLLEKCYNGCQALGEHYFQCKRADCPAPGRVVLCGRCFQKLCPFCRQAIRREDVSSVSDKLPTRSDNSRIGPLARQAGFRVHVSNMDFAVTDDVLTNHMAQAAPVLSCRISTKKNGRSNGWAHVEFTSVADAQAALSLDGTQLEHRRLKVRLDADLATSLQVRKVLGSPDWVRDQISSLRCRLCSTGLRSAGFALLEDLQLLKDAAREEDISGYFLVCSPDKVQNCNTEVHPKRELQPYKLEIITCSSCGANLGNVQAGARSEGHKVSNLAVDDHLAHFRAESVVLTFADCPGSHLRLKKWSSLTKLIGEDQPVHALTMQLFVNARERNVFTKGELQLVSDTDQALLRSDASSVAARGSSAQ